MKKRTMLFVLVMFCLGITINVKAASNIVDGITWYYNIVGEGALIVSHSSHNSASINVPSSLGGCPVTEIGNLVFSGCRTLTSITIPNSVVSIGLKAFSKCSGLRSITIPDSVTNIGERAFQYCDSLRSVTVNQYVLDRGLQVVFSSPTGSNPTYNHTSITNVAFTPGVTRISDYAFSGCSGLTSLTLPDGVVYVGFDSFRDCSGLKSIVIPNGVERIGIQAFMDCSSLGSVTLPDGIVGIAADAFNGCYNLKSMSIPGSVRDIGTRVFSECSGLKSITIPDSVTNIGERAFQYCDSLTSISIPSSVRNIGYYVFQNCSALTDIYITQNLSGFVGVLKYGNSANVHFITSGRVPYTWIDKFKDCAAFCDAVVVASGDYEKMAQIKGLNDYTFEQCYVAGLDPTKADDTFVAKIKFVDGLPVITYDPDLGGERMYVTEGVSELGGEWTEIKSDADKADKRFFRVRVVLPK